jgi:outer membrane protein TolC
VDAARAAYRPRVSLLGSSDWFDDEPGLENRSWRVMGVVSMNLFSGGADRNRVAAARHDLVAEQARLKSMDLSIRHELRQALLSLHGAVQRYQIVSASLGQARRGVKLVDERYGQGRTILIDLLQAERALVDTRSEAVAAALAVYNARAALALAAGTATEGRP